MNEKTLPQSIDIEQSVLSTCLHGEAEPVCELITPEIFYKTSHKKIFNIISKLHSDSDPVDMVAVVEKLRSIGILGDVGGPAYIAELFESPVATNIEYYCGILLDKYHARKLIDQCYGAIKQCFDGDVNEAIKTIIESTDEINNEQSNNNKIKPIGEYLPERIDRYEELRASGGVGITGISTGFYKLDKITSGLQPGDLIIVAGRPSMGKTALAWNMACNASGNGLPVVMYSLEQPRSQLIDRTISGETHINSQLFKTGKFNLAEWENIIKASSRINDWPLFVNEKPGMDCGEIVRDIGQMIKKNGAKLAVIDYLQLMKFPKIRRDDAEIGDVTKTLKSTARKYNIPIVLICQLNRKVEERTKAFKRPMMSDLRESGNIEQDADVICFVYRDEYYCEKCRADEDCHSDHKGVAEIIIAKQRNGPTGTVKLTWLNKYTKFENPKN
uniref:DNA 5'-3' helicase n=1 Tax=viral metagenome TaxID=1070528 RepID=A0A6H1ZGL7_9ZZZZ